MEGWVEPGHLAAVPTRSDIGTGEREIAELYRRHIAWVRGRARRLLGSDSAAQDLAQETFLKFLEFRGSRPTEQATAAYLYRMVTNLGLNRLRDERRRREALASPEARDALGDGRPTTDPDDVLLLRQVLARVPEEEAQIAAYFYLDGLEHDEIAELLGLQRRTVGRRLERFRDSARAISREAP